MGSPTSEIMSEIFLRNMENKNFLNIAREHKIRLLAWYVDDILAIYDSVTSNENYNLNDLNNKLYEQK